MKFAAFLFLLMTLPVNAAEPKAHVSREPLDAVRLAIYSDFLKTYDNGSKTTLNVSETTTPFRSTDFDKGECLAGNIEAPMDHTVFHRFSEDFAKANNISLVNGATHHLADPTDAMKQGKSVDDATNAGFAAGVLTFSEITFDTKHKLAVFTYGFVCGRFCGSGGTAVYEFKAGHWQKGKQSCGVWMS